MLEFLEFLPQYYRSAPKTTLLTSFIAFESKYFLSKLVKKIRCYVLVTPVFTRPERLLKLFKYSMIQTGIIR